MTVKTLQPHQKELIGALYKAKKMNQKQLAIEFKTSERTINRVLNELGLATAVPRIKGEAYQVMQVLKKHGVTTPGQLDVILTLPINGMHKAKVTKFLMDLPEDEYAPLLSMVTMARVAKASNTSVQTALLNVENKVNKNAHNDG